MVSVDIKQQWTPSPRARACVRACVRVCCVLCVCVCVCVQGGVSVWYMCVCARAQNMPLYTFVFAVYLLVGYYNYVCSD